MLALVFVQALYLHVEHRVWIDLYSAFVLYDFGHALFVLELYAHELLLETFVVRVFFENAYCVQILRPAHALNLCVYKGRKPRIARFKPSARGYAVRFVVEFFRREIVEAAQDAVFEQFRMQRRNPVYAEAADHREIRHTDHFRRALFYNGEVLLLADIVRIFFGDFSKPARINFVNYLQVPRQKLFKEGNRPFFESLRQQRVVCICKNLFAHAPRLVPRQMVFVHHNAHELRYRDCRVGVV